MNSRWQITTLGAVCEILMGQSPDGASYNAKGLGIPLINGPVEFGRGDFGRTIRSKFTTQPTKLCKAQDLILCVRGSTTGRMNIAAFDACIGRGVAAIRAKQNQAWIDYFIYSKRCEIHALGTGATFPNVSGAMLSTLELPMPPLAEQQRIVGILDQAFAAIATAKANTEKNLQNARALFESHLESAFQDGKLQVPLTSLLSEQPRNGWSPPAEFQTGSGTPVLTLSSVTGFQYNGSKVKLSSAPTKLGAHYWLKDGELLITRSNTRELVGHVAMYDGTPRKAICCDLIMKMRVHPDKALTRFVYFYLRSAAARAYLTTQAHGASSTMKKIGKEVVQQIQIPHFTLAEQSKIAANLDRVLDQSKCLESIYKKKLAALENLKRSILDRAFSGAM